MRITIAACVLLCPAVSGFVSPIHVIPFLATRTLPNTSLNMAGFGGGESSQKGSKKLKKSPSMIKVKPKSQWDKYINLKKASVVKVAVRVANEGSDAGEWYEIGKIKSDGDEFTQVAVVVQRGIIAEHARRLYPLKFAPKDKVEWAYDSNSDWVIVDKSAASASPSGIEKKIGFEGNPDPSGFYTKLVNNFGSGATAGAPLASGSGMLDQSVLPRIK